jgi:hypothetical protein
MPAPQATMMSQLARAKFMSFGLTVPDKWRAPSGDPDEQHYRDAFKPEEKTTAPAVPPLFRAASGNKYHTDAQKMHCAKIGKFIDDTCGAICTAWSTWQTSATMVGVVINAVTAAGGQIVGPPWTPLILAKAPKESQALLRYSNVIANVIGTAWLSFTATVKVPGLPWYPAFAAFPGPMAPPVPNVPVPFAALTQVPVSISMNMLKTQMVGQLADPTAPFSSQLFESIADAFEKSYNTWKVSTMVTNVLGTGAIPTFAPPYVPVGPVVGGVGTMTPGGFT